MDHSDIPERETGSRVRLARKELLETLLPDIVQEMARYRVKELQATGYEISEKLSKIANFLNEILRYK